MHVFNILLIFKVKLHFKYEMLNIQFYMLAKACCNETSADNITVVAAKFVISKQSDKTSEIMCTKETAPKSS